MAKGDADIPEWKKRVPYEKSEAAYHKEPQKPVKKVEGVAVKQEKVKLPEDMKGRIESAKSAEHLKSPGIVKGFKETVAGGKDIREAMPKTAAARPDSASARTCDACGRIHSARCEIVKYAGQDFNVCGECIPPVKENPADFLAGKKGTDPESMDFDVCGTIKK
jgi:hypothetical protein